MDNNRRNKENKSVNKENKGPYIAARHPNQDNKGRNKDNRSVRRLPEHATSRIEEQIMAIIGVIQKIGILS